MLAEPTHWCSGLGTLLFNERAGVRIRVGALFFFFFFFFLSLKFSKFNSRGQRSLPVQEASQVGNRCRRVECPPTKVSPRTFHPRVEYPPDTLP